jgi:hypothetical protein
MNRRNFLKSILGLIALPLLAKVPAPPLAETFARKEEIFETNGLIPQARRYHSDLGFSDAMSDEQIRIGMLHVQQLIRAQNYRLFIGGSG